MSTLLEFVDVSKWYGQVSALTDVGFGCGPGVTGLVGRNGAGKSTILKLACGLLRPSTGSVRLVGLPPSSVEARRALGYCPDVDRFYEEMTGRAFLAAMLRLDGLATADARRRAGELLDEIGLGDAMHRRIGGYSKGMRQRVKLAQAFGKRPQVVLLDEPLTGLDPVARHEVSEVIRRIAREGAAVLVSSHVLHELQSLAESGVLLVHQGRLLAQGRVDELRAQMLDRPHRLRLRSSAPRALAARLLALEAVESITIVGEEVRVETRTAAGVLQEITRLGALPENLVRELATIDDDLEAVFGYLVP